MWISVGNISIQVPLIVEKRDFMLRWNWAERREVQPKETIYRIIYLYNLRFYPEN